MTVLDIKGITKSFGSLVANDNISLTLSEGEVLALLGENGAGKTTLMNILFGHYVADQGEIELFGTRLMPGATDAAIDAGVGMVHQHFTLADNLSVLENIVLGTEPLTSWKSNTAQAKIRLAALAEEFGMHIEPDKLVADISVGERQRVEIVKALYRGAKILILDEPTAVLTPQEVDSLFATLRTMVARGLSIIFISHKLHEILAISDRVNVLRRGCMVGEIATKDANRDSLAEMMVGREVSRPKVEHMEAGAPVVEIDNVVVSGGRGHKPLLDGVSLSIHKHEIVGLAGVAGNGQSALGDLLSGLRAPTSGSVRIAGDTVKDYSARSFIATGIGRIPEDRHAKGVVGDMTVWENMISENLREKPLWRFGRIIDFDACREFSRNLIEHFDVRCKTMEMPTKQLSGGNMQKLILARTLQNEPRFILANQPVRGLDEGAIAAVHERLLAAKRAGAGVLLVSEDLDELFALADKIVVIYHGNISEPLSVDEVTAQDIGIMMAGDLGHGKNLNRAGVA
ncbi:MAG: ABC transporter ATP-binding protein [Rhodospirillales bacterium]|nr:ABC transporter ATP-binding protein [Rhodospirillales bacterium]